MPGADEAGQAILGLSLQGNELQLLDANSTKDEQIARLNDIIRRLNELLKTQVFSDGNNKRMLFGFQKDGWGEGKDFGMKISIEGVDVTSATEDQLLFNMDMDRWMWLNNGIPFSLMGQAPDESRSGFWIADDGIDVRDKI